jgi:molybdate transport system ATP-binding protein
VLDLAVAKRFGRFQLEVALTAAAGDTVVVVGESGSGKTTLLRLIAGIEQPDTGRIVVGDHVYVDTTRGTVMPAWERDIGYVPQDYTLFPHLTVEQNVAFGLRALGMGREPASQCAARALDRMGIAEFAAARPRDLSGGQQQRVAIARALVLDPAVLLLDEPLSALDLATRQSIRHELRQLLANPSCVTLYVTHAPTEVVDRGDRIVTLDHGHVVPVDARDALS